MSDITQNREIKEEDIPIVTEFKQGVEPEGLRVTADAHPANCFIASAYFRSDKIVLLFDPAHPEYGKEWATKYFRFSEPGVMEWGHEGKTMTILRAEE